MNEVKMFLDIIKASQDFEPNSAMYNLNKGEYLNIITLPFLQNLLKSTINYSGEDFHQKIQLYIKSHLNLQDTLDNQLEFLAVGIAPLILFIQKNWTGPDFTLSEELWPVGNLKHRSVILKEMAEDGENVIPVVEYPELLYLSIKILEALYIGFTDSQIIKIWYFRSLFIHQQILEELSPNLFEKIKNITNEIRPFLQTFPKWTTIALYLEFSRIFMYYSNIQTSKMDVQSATDLANIDISLSGALGKRTKFQCEDLAQLTLNVKVNDVSNSLKELGNETCTLPIDLKLEDDVRLDKIKFADNVSYTLPSLSGLQQSVILGNLFQTQKSQPKDSLADEELQPLINCILDQPKVWSIRTTTLLLRSQLEANHKRTVERSMMQVQVLADSIKDTNITMMQKLSYLFISHLPPKWVIQSVLANILASMGSIKSALEIYLNLEDWENVICCYNILQLRHKAQEIIEQELKKNPTPKLWCLLGDATDDVMCYEKAWELSNKRSARSQRHWALFYYNRKNYAKSIEHFQKSLEINSLQKEMWYRLGYAALIEEKWEISASAYRRYVVLDPDCFEAWNNLARCYCELKQKYRAWRALQEALKVDYSNWKVWDNYMVVSSDLKMFDDVIKSYHEILNLKEKHLDIGVLNALILGFHNFQTQGKEQENLEQLNKFRSKLLELFGRLTSQIINNVDLWFLYSEVVNCDTSENLIKKYQLLLKAHRSAINLSGWEKNLETCNRIVYILSKLLEVGLLIKKPDILMSCKLAATSALTKIKKEYPDVDVCDNLEKNLLELEKAMNN